MKQQEKKEVLRKKGKFDSLLLFDIHKIPGLRVKKADPRYKKYASLNRRMLASTIDSGIAAFTIAPILQWVLAKFVHSREITTKELSAVSANQNEQFTALMKLLHDSGKLSEFLINTSAQSFLFLLFTAICWKIWSATPGKMLMRIKVVDADSEQPMTDKQILIRCLGYIPACAAFFIGIFWISFNKRCQGWHDKMANTVVIINTKSKKLDAETDADLLSKSIETSAAAS